MRDICRVISAVTRGFGFFRSHSKDRSKLLVYNDKQEVLRSTLSNPDPYGIFQKKALHFITVLKQASMASIPLYCRKRQF